MKPEDILSILTKVRSSPFLEEPSSVITATADKVDSRGRILTFIFSS